MRSTALHGAISSQLGDQRSYLTEVVAALLGYRTHAAPTVDEADTTREYHLDDAEIYVLNAGCVGAPVAQGVCDILGEHLTVQRSPKRSELHTFKVMPRRRIVERSFAWLDKNRWEQAAAVRELRATARYPAAIRPSGILGSAAQESANTF